MENIRKISNIPYFRLWLNMFDYKSKIKRKEFLIDYILSLILIFFFIMLCINVSLWFLIVLVVHVYLLIPLTVNRIRDTGNSPYLIFLIFLGGIGVLAIFILCCLKTYQIEKNTSLTKSGSITIVASFIASFAFPVVMAIFILLGGVLSKDYTSEYKQKFDPLTNKETYIFVDYEGVSYLDNYYKIKNLDYDGSLFDGFVIYEKNYYFMTSNKDDDKYSLNEYKLNLIDGSLTCVNNYMFNNSIYIYSNNFSFYIETRNDKDELELYSLNIENHSLNLIGNNITYYGYSSILDINEKYFCYVNNSDEFVVTDLYTMEQHYIGEDLLNTLEAGRILMEYDYRFYNNNYIVGDDIYLFYAIDSRAFLPGNYYVIFKYNFLERNLDFVGTYSENCPSIYMA